MADNKDTTISPTIKTTLSNFGTAIKKKIPNMLINNRRPQENSEDEFKHSGLEPLPPEKRVESAVAKFNAANDVRIAAETNYSAELYSNSNLLQMYKAYKNPISKDLTLNPISEDTVQALHKGKPFEIKLKEDKNGHKEHEINYQDGSQIKYVLFSEGEKMKIYGEEFEMPAGTVLEIKSVNNRVFSQLIQTPNMSRSVVNIPEVVVQAEHILSEQKKTS